MLPGATKIGNWNKKINKQTNAATQSNKHTITPVPRRPYYADHMPNIYHPDVIHNTRHGPDIYHSLYIVVTPLVIHLYYSP